MTAADRATAHRAIATIYDEQALFEQAASRLWDALGADVQNESQPVLIQFSSKLRLAVAEAIRRLDPGPPADTEAAHAGFAPVVPETVPAAVTGEVPTRFGTDPTVTETMPSDLNWPPRELMKRVTRGKADGGES